MTKLEQLQAIKDSVADVAGEILLEVGQYNWLVEQVEILLARDEPKTNSGALLNWCEMPTDSTDDDGIYVSGNGFFYSQMPKSTHVKSAIRNFRETFPEETGALSVTVVKGGKSRIVGP